MLPVSLIWMELFCDIYASASRKTAGKSPVKNVDLWKRLLEAKKEHDVEFIWVKGHAGHEYNERCDSLAVAASKADNLKIEVV